VQREADIVELEHLHPGRHGRLELGVVGVGQVAVERGLVVVVLVGQPAAEVRRAHAAAELHRARAHLPGHPPQLGQVHGARLDRSGHDDVVPGAAEGG
jgi:hypothetical protein